LYVPRVMKLSFHSLKSFSFAMGTHRNGGLPPTKSLMCTGFNTGLCFGEKNNMVYCTNCGTNNADDATICIKCGAPLHGAVSEGRTRWGRARYEREYGFYRRDRPLIGIIIGIVVIFIGLSFLLREYGILVPWWEILLIILGIYLIVRWLRAWNRRK
jgi:hypothetical protein